MKLHGAGFIITPEEAALLLPLPLGEGWGEGQRTPQTIIRDYRNSRDRTNAPREGWPLSAREKIIHTQGLVSVLKELNDEMDGAARRGGLARIRKWSSVGKAVVMNARAPVSFPRKRESGPVSERRTAFCTASGFPSARE